MEIIGDSLEALWVEAASAVMVGGEKRAPRGQPTRELTGMQLVLTDPRNRIPKLPVREFSLAYGMGELAWYLCGDNTVEFIKHYAPSYGKYSDDGKLLHGAYGPRIFGKTCLCSWDEHRCNAHRGSDSQWELCKQILQRDQDSRQAVIAVYDRQDCDAVTKDMPCTLSLQFLVRNNALNMIVNMRSNDLWFGGVYDVFCFTALQELMANELKLPLGVYYHHVGSFHLYERNMPAIERCLAEYEGAPYKLPQPRIAVNQTIDELLHSEKRIRTCAPVTALEELCHQMEDWNWSQMPTLWELGFAAWRWKRISNSVEIKETQRRLARGLLEERLGRLFNLCFF